MDIDINRLTKVRDEIELSVRLSRGWWKTIAKESGCRLTTLERIAGEENYDPVISELALIDAYFLVHGVRRRGPQGKKKRALLEEERGRRDQIDIKDQLARDDPAPL